MRDRGGSRGVAGRDYRRAVIEKYGFPGGWVANWPPGRGRNPGDVGTVVDPGFNQDGALADYDMSAVQAPAQGPSAGPWSFTSSETISVEIGTDATVPAWQWIGNAKAGLKLVFGSQEGIVLSVGSSSFRNLANLDALKADLLAAGQTGKMGVGKSVIVEALMADNGLVITSDGQTGTLEATTDFDVAGMGSPTLAAFAANFNLRSNSAAFSNLSFPMVSAWHFVRSRSGSAAGYGGEEWLCAAQRIRPT